VTGPAPDTTGLRPWLEAVTAKYGHLIDDILLVGSRSAGYERPDSDWDVVLCLLERLYADPDAAVNAEQAIAFDQLLPRPEQGLDLFVVRPGGELVRWEQLPDWDGVQEEAETGGTFASTWLVVNGYIQGPTGDFSRFFKEWAHCCPEIWPASAAQVTQ
jgi:predicted nucleotidyltransferase